MTESPVMLVAGGTGSIGRVVVAEALAAGWHVVQHGRRAPSADVGIVSGPDASAMRLLRVAADLEEEGSVQQLVSQAAGWQGRLDAVIDCVSAAPAGARVTGLFSDTEPDGYAALLGLSVGHVERLAHAALPWLKQRGGTFIAFASDAGRFAASGQALIGASRAAIMGFVRNLALEVARDAVRVHCISPSFVAGSDSARRLAEQSRDRMQRAEARAGLGLPTPADIAPLVLFLCGEGARRITGQVISVNGGLNA